MLATLVAPWASVPVVFAWAGLTVLAFGGVWWRGEIEIFAAPALWVPIFVTVAFIGTVVVGILRYRSLPNARGEYLRPLILLGGTVAFVFGECCAFILLEKTLTIFLAGGLLYFACGVAVAAVFGLIAGKRPTAPA